jgi:hypothetical protein
MQLQTFVAKHSDHEPTIPQAPSFVTESRQRPQVSGSENHFTPVNLKFEFLGSLVLSTLEVAARPMMWHVHMRWYSCTPFHTQKLNVVSMKRLHHLLQKAAQGASPAYIFGAPELSDRCTPAVVSKASCGVICELRAE